jgi:hypothetical protein
MPPKTDPPAAKLAAIVSFIQSPPKAYTLKDLEKAIPAATGVSSMQVKDFLQHLASTDRVCVEKIGSGNWYWSFPADQTIKLREKVEKARKDQRDLENMIVNAQGEIDSLGGEGDKQLALDVAAASLEHKTLTETFEKLSKGGKKAVKQKMKEVQEVNEEWEVTGGMLAFRFSHYLS